MYFIVEINAREFSDYLGHSDVFAVVSDALAFG
jgi:hypothetical protein